MSDTFVADISNYQANVDLPTYRASNGKIICQISWGTAVTVNPLRVLQIASLKFDVVIWYLGLRADQDIAAQVAAFTSMIPVQTAGETYCVDWEATGNINPPTLAQVNQARSLLAAHYGILPGWIGTYGSTSIFQSQGLPDWGGWVWVASYETAEPNIAHVLWQFTNGTYQSQPYGPINFPGIGFVDGSVFHAIDELIPADIQLQTLISPPLPAPSVPSVPSVPAPPAPPAPPVPPVPPVPPTPTPAPVVPPAPAPPTLAPVPAVFNPVKLPRLSYGMSGAAVYALQALLSEHGFTVPSTGVYDDATKTAVLNLKAKANLPFDDIVGPGVWTFLLTTKP